MSKIPHLLVAMAAAATWVTGYAQPVYPNGPNDRPPPQAERVEYGVVENIEMYRSDQQHNPINLGTVIGGVAGGVIGHQIGSGRGNTAATVAGAVGGAVVGNEINRSTQKQSDQYRIVVRLDSGAQLAVTEVGEGALRVGDRVRVVNNRVFRA